MTGSAQVPDRGAPPAVRLDASGGCAWLGERRLPLTATELAVLRVLVREAGRAVPRERLLREIWGTGSWISGRTLDVHVSGLRRKLGDPARHPRYIATVRGVGFRFDPPPAEGLVEGLAGPPASAGNTQRR